MEDAKGMHQEENRLKDMKKLMYLLNRAKGENRTIGMFAADCKLDVDYLLSYFKMINRENPSRGFLKIISDNSRGHVSLKELEIACGYSQYKNNNLEEIKNIRVKRGYFVYADFGEVIDSEYGGYRVVLVVQNDRGNYYSPTTIVLPVTSRKSKSNIPTHVEIKASESGLQYDSIISCEQIRCISKGRLRQRGIVQTIGECPAHIMEKVAIAMNKAQGVINLDVDEETAIDYLYQLNLSKNEYYSTKNNYNVSEQRRLAYL